MRLVSVDFLDSVFNGLFSLAQQWMVSALRGYRWHHKQASIYSLNPVRVGYAPRRDRSHVRRRHL